MPIVINNFDDIKNYFDTLSGNDAEEYRQRISEVLDNEDVKYDLQLCIDLQNLSLSTNDPEKGALLASVYSMLFKYYEADVNMKVFDVQAEFIESDPNIKIDDQILNNGMRYYQQKYKDGHLDFSSVMIDQPPYYQEYLRYSAKDRHAVIKNLAEKLIYGSTETDISDIPAMEGLKAYTESMIRANALELIDHSLDNSYDDRMRWLGFSTDQLDNTAKNFRKAGITKATASAAYKVAGGDLSADRFDNIADMDTSYQALQNGTPEKEKTIRFALQPILDVNTEINANDYLEHFKNGTLTSAEVEWASASVNELMTFAYNGKRDPEGFQGVLDSSLPMFGFFIDGKNILEIPDKKNGSVTFGQMLDKIHESGDSNESYNDLMSRICETVVASALDGKKLDLCRCEKTGPEYKLSNDPIRLSTSLDPALSADEKRGFSLWRWIKRLFGHGRTIAEKVNKANKKADDREKEQKSIDELFDKTSSREKISLTELLVAADPKMTAKVAPQKSNLSKTKSK